jgi:MFS family permease
MSARFAAAASDTFRSLRHRNFRLYFSGLLVSTIGRWLSTAVLTLLVLELTDSGIAVGILAACQFGPMLVGGAWAGLLADRHDKRRLLIVVQSLGLLQGLALAALAFQPEPPLLLIYAMAVLGGCINALDNPARRSMIPELVPDDDLQNAVSLHSALMTLSKVIGPALGGLLIETVGYGWALMVFAVSHVAVVSGLAMMDKRTLHPAPPTSPAKGQVRAGLRYVLTVPELRISLAMLAVIGTLAYNFQVVFPLFVYRTFGGDGQMFTLLFSVTSLGSLVFALAVARRRTASLGGVVRAAFALGASLSVFALSPTLAVAFPLALLVGGTSTLLVNVMNALLQHRCEPEMRGRVMALQAILFIGTTPIGGPLVGWVSEVYDPRAALALGGVATLLTAAWGAVAARRVAARAPTPAAPVVEQVGSAT